MKKLACFTFILLLSACASSTRHFSLIVPDEAGFHIRDLDHAVVARGIRGQDTAPIVLFFALGQPSFQEAVNQTLKNGGGNVLVNADVTTYNRWYGLFGYNRISVRGDVVKTR